MDVSTDVTGIPVWINVRAQIISHIAIAGIQEIKERSLMLIRKLFVTARNTNTVPAKTVEKASAVGFSTIVIKKAFPAMTKSMVFCSFTNRIRK